jgi:hypothetical protein
MYPFLQIDGDTEIVHSEMLPNGEVKVYVEKPDSKDGFHNATCFLPSYRWEDINGFTVDEIARYQDMIEFSVHLITVFS